MIAQSDMRLNVWKCQLITHGIPKFKHFTPNEETP